MQLRYLCSVLLCSAVVAVPVLEEEILRNGELSRSIRSPLLFKKKHLLGTLLGGGGHEGGATHITNINNYGPNNGPANHGHGHGGGGSFAGSFAGAGGHGQSQSQSASFSFGPHSASFSQSQSGGGKRGGLFDDYDY